MWSFVMWLSDSYNPLITWERMISFSSKSPNTNRCTSLNTFMTILNWQYWKISATLHYLIYFRFPWLSEHQLFFPSPKYYAQIIFTRQYLSTHPQVHVINFLETIMDSILNKDESHLMLLQKWFQIFSILS